MIGLMPALLLRPKIVAVVANTPSGFAMAQIRCSRCGKTVGERDGLRFVPEVGNLCDACFDAYLEEQRRANTTFAVLTAFGVIIAVVLVVTLLLSA